ncbi:MAG: aminotransferase class V-fold PLP-dependent enzyme, partial [Bacteroidales bacterium]
MAEKHFESGIAYARRADHHDPLGRFRMSFFIPEPNIIYLDGNSLGRLPHRTRERLQQTVDHQWGKRLIRSWNEGWYDMPRRLGARLAPIIGAGEDEVIVGDSTSLNLFKAAWASVKLKQNRTRIITDDLNFPTDLYVLQGIARQLGADYEVALAHSSDGLTLSQEDLKKVLNDNTALVVLSHVAFKSAFMHDMKAVTDLVHSHGALMLWDLSHSAGVVPVQLSDADADLAIGCTYKYLNGGPGAPAWLFVKKELQNMLESPVWGWFGDDNPFAFNLEYKPAAGMSRFLVGTPPVIS